MQEKKGGSSRRERERQRHRKEILSSAERVFVREGLKQASMEEIAREAEFSVGTLYNFFQNKNDLFKNIILAGQLWMD